MVQYLPPQFLKRRISRKRLKLLGVIFNIIRGYKVGEDCVAVNNVFLER